MEQEQVTPPQTHSKTLQQEPVNQHEAPSDNESKILEGRYHPSLGDPNVKKPKLEDIAYLDYKSWPNIAHNDPHSKKYISSERDEYHDKVKVDSFNYYVDSIKRDIKLQNEVNRVLEKMDRPYKNGIPGIHKNITGGVRDYFPQGDLGFKTPKDDDDDKFLNEHFSNQARFTQQTIFTPKFAPLSHMKEWENDILNRPTTKNFHPEKGYKYDIEVPYDERFPHVADRFGYPEILGTPFERLMRLEGEIYHPVYLDQPFVNVPPTEPNSNLNFEEGEVIYENSRLLEWARFWNLTGLTTFAFSALFIPYSLIYKTHLPLPSSYDNLFVPYHGHTPFFFDANSLQIPVVSFIAAYSIYIYMVTLLYLA